MDKIEETTKLVAEKRKRTIEDMQELAKKHGGRCLSEIYINSRSRLKWECKNGHIWKCSTREMRRTKIWCPKCRDSM